MNDVDAPRADESSYPAGNKRPAASLARLAAAPAVVALAYLLLGPPLGWAGAPIGRVTGVAQMPDTRHATSAEGGSVSSLMRRSGLSYLQRRERSLPASYVPLPAPDVIIVEDSDVGAGEADPGPAPSTAMPRHDLPGAGPAESPSLPAREGGSGVGYSMAVGARPVFAPGHPQPRRGDTLLSQPVRLPTPPTVAYLPEPDVPRETRGTSVEGPTPAPPGIRLPNELGNPPMMAIREPVVGPIPGELLRPSETAPIRSVQALPFVRPIQAPSVRLNRDAPARQSDVAVVRPSKARALRPAAAARREPVQTGPIRSMDDLPLRLSRNAPVAPPRGGAGRSVVRAAPLTTARAAPVRPNRQASFRLSRAAEGRPGLQASAGPVRELPTRLAPNMAVRSVAAPPGRGNRDAPMRAVQNTPFRSTEAAPFESVQVALLRPSGSGPIRSVQNLPFGPVSSVDGRDDDPPGGRIPESTLRMREEALVSTFGGLLGEAEPRSPLGSGAIELEIDLESPFRAEPDAPSQAGTTEGRPGGDAAASKVGHPPVSSLTTDIRTSAGEMPPDDARREYLPMGDVPAGPQPGRAWNRRMYLWEASSLCHRPLYFEEINLERYGFFCCDHRCGGVPAALVQPVLSGAHFFAAVPALPYKMTLDPPCKGIYTLGHYRPGSCVPHRIHRIPVRPLPAAVEACAITGLVFAIP